MKSEPEIHVYINKLGEKIYVINCFKIHEKMWKVLIKKGGKLV